MNPHLLRCRQRAFTLIEVVIALAILAVALAATGRAAHTSADSSATLKNKLLAGWVAQNRLAELQLADQLPSKGERSGEAEQGGLRFIWKEHVTQTKNQGILRVEINVSTPYNPDYNAARLIGFLADLRPKPGNAQGGTGTGGNGANQDSGSGANSGDTMGPGDTGDNAGDGSNGAGNGEGNN